MSLENAARDLANAAALLAAATGGRTDVRVSGGNVTATPSSRESISGLSFVETLTALGSYQTDWVDTTSYEWLDIVIEMQTNDAVTGTIETTDASDPNTTPPGASDIVTNIEQPIAGAGLGGPADVISFGLKAGMRWMRFTVTDLTGGQIIKVRAYGRHVNGAAGILPLAGTVTPDYSAPLTQSVLRAFDPSDTFRTVRYSGIVAEQSSTANILAAASFTGSEWTSTTGYIGVSLFLKSAANSATDGVILQISFDDGATVHYENPRTYDAAPDGVIFKWSIATPGAVFRMKVTAGGSNMTDVVLKTYLLSHGTEDVSVRVGDLITPDMIADVVKSQGVGLRDDGVTGANQSYSDNDNPRQSIKEHEIATPIAPLNAGGKCTKTTVNTGAAAKIVTTPLANRAGIRGYTDAANTDVIYYGYNSGITPGSTDSFKWVAGANYEWDHGPSTDLYVCTNTNGQVIWVEEVADTGVRA